ncbi:bifunctional polysaccharide deacetylase/glycosyltransferase family 2 protein [Couchioplanes caeruleus]|uniref:bifunctional polysaccharide deacetylase/glycosyltransferase family 2 protein n=1 Tax=Couchioplanes caeruleus TaxID=56438 RepID=UPI0020BDEFD1|nr:bifunctional polysaccharide deacetylase/glycosyltransferase family 2 protein [Couchioplanes caeruleus]UQU65811.1 bifunctional polysaccharide deacetylase/glycosyltransferase family 2 protein [Couchioplanes caeruleus]
MTRTPRTHWVLLGAVLTVLFVSLCANGYVNHIGAEGVRTPGPAAPAMRAGGPVQGLTADRATRGLRMPPRTLALTFDDGPDPRWTPRILDVLRRHHARATFFVLGANVARYPELTRRIVAEGHELGVHTYTHADLAGLPAWRQRAEIAATQSVIASTTGVRTRLLRPPYSSTPDAVTVPQGSALDRAAADGYLTVLTDLDTADWRRPGAAAIVRAGTPAAGRGAVVMLHDGGGDRTQTVAAVDRLLAGLPGYRFETVSTALDLPRFTGTPLALTLRGHAIAGLQWLGGVAAAAMGVLLIVAVALGVARLLLQVYYSRRHIRRTRTRRHRDAHFGTVTVVVPAYNESANIANTVRSLRASTYQPVEIIVVDDGSGDDTAGIVERLDLPGVRVIRQANAGKPAALNTGIRAASGDLLVLVDGDTVFAPDAIRRLVQPFADLSVGAVSGNTKVANRSGVLGRWQHLEYVIGFNLDRRMFDLVRCMPTVPGAIGAFRRETLADVGGVPDATLAEDTDLTMAVIRAGWRVVYEPDAVAWTEVPGTLAQLWRQRYRWCYGTMQAMWKHRRCLVERGAGGRLGRRGLTYLLLFQVLLPLTAPAVDVAAAYGMIFLPWPQLLATWAGFQLLQLLTAAYALRLDGERYGPLWSLPLQQIVYRQLMYLVVVHATVAALLGDRQRWHRMHRTGQADLALVSSGSR